MPTTLMFCGIVVMIHCEDTRRNHKPHVYVRCQGKKAAIAIENCKVFAGNFPPKQLHLVLAWIEIHEEQLMAS